MSARITRTRSTLSWVLATIGLLVCVLPLAVAARPTTPPAPRVAPRVGAPSHSMAYWSVPRKGANGGPTRLRPEWFRAAAAAGIEFVRLRPDDLAPAGRDFLMGSADDYQGLVPADVALLRTVLDEADRQGLRVVLTMFSLPGCRYKQRNGDRDDDRMWRDEQYQQQALRFWRDLAAALEDHPAIVAYNPLNEPHPERSHGIYSSRDSAFAPWFARVQGTTADVHRFNERVVAAIREVDPATPILLDGWFYADPEGFAYNLPVDDPGTLYALHNPAPWKFSTFRVNRERFAYPGRMPAGRGAATQPWTIDSLRALVRPVAEFAARHRIAPHRIVASEFFCDRRVGGAAEYMTDMMRIYHDAGWHWSFYEFRPEGGFTGYDYEVAANARFGERYWLEDSLGHDVEALKPRGVTPIWSAIRRELVRK